MKRFALIGAGGYIAPRHMQAIRDTGNRLIAALDPNDSVGIMDSYFPDANFFHRVRALRPPHLQAAPGGPERRLHFDRVPNYLHDSHIRFALRSGSDAICESRWCSIRTTSTRSLEMESETGRKVNTILTCSSRVHPAIVALREKMLAAPRDRKVDVNLTYITPAVIGICRAGRATRKSRAASPQTSACTSTTCFTSSMRSAGKRRASADTDEGRRLPRV